MAKVLHLYHACIRERAIEWLTTATTATAAVKILLENNTPFGLFSLTPSQTFDSFSLF